MMFDGPPSDLGYPSMADVAETRPIDIGIDDTDPTDMVGLTLSDTNLRLEELCGSGGTGEVYRAKDLETGAMSAVKVLRPGRDRKLMTDEVRVLGDIDSPWVVHSRSFGLMPDGAPWMSMEYLPGRSLRRALEEQGPIEPLRVLGWMQQVCRGLSQTHAKGWVHRDIKPDNLLLVEEGDEERIVIIDFGIADRIDAQPRDLSGTPDYIAPEQALRKPVDLRSDLYSLACCAYELLTGQRPVSSSDVQSKIDTHVDGVRLKWPDTCVVPVPLRRLLEHCMALHPNNRPASARALELELERCRVQIARASSEWRFVAPTSRGRHAPVPRVNTLVGHPGVAGRDADTLVARASA